VDVGTLSKTGTSPLKTTGLVDSAMMEVNPVQPEKVLAPIEVTEFGIVIEVKPEQLLRRLLKFKALNI
jgi:hypothetical protein